MPHPGAPTSHLRDCSKQHHIGNRATERSLLDALFDLRTESCQTPSPVFSLFAKKYTGHLHGSVDAGAGGPCHAGSASIRATDRGLVMDAQHFDNLVQSLAVAGTRRGLLRRLPLSLLASLFAFLAPRLGDESKAARRHQNRR